MVTAGSLRSPLFLPLALAAGLLGVIHDSWGQPSAGSWMNFHVLFGALLWVSVVARFYRRLRHTPGMLPVDLHALTRHLSRLVYLILYVLLFFSVLIGISHTAPHRAIGGPAEDFRSYLACGCVALVTIHALSALYRRFVIPGGAYAPTQLAQRNGRLM